MLKSVFLDQFIKEESEKIRGLRTKSYRTQAFRRLTIRDNSRRLTEKS